MTVREALQQIADAGDITVEPAQLIRIEQL